MDNDKINQQQINYAYSSAVPHTKVQKKRKKWPIVLAASGGVLLVLCIGLAIASIFSSSTAPSNEFKSPGTSYVAKISVIGEISSTEKAYSSSDESYHHKWTLEMIEDIMKDKNNVGLILVVDTPGGGVYESDELYYKIEKYKKETRRPVYVYMRSMAASGGYYISAPATEIVANRNTWTGSIGVIVGTMFDVSGFLEKNGIKADDITSGANKSMGSIFKPMTKEQKAIFQSMVDEAYGQFVDIVASGRGMSVDAVKKVADGRILTANQALNAGLVDKIMNEEDFYSYVKEKQGKDVTLEDLKYKASGDMMSSLIPSLIEAFKGKPDALKEEAVQGDISRVLELAQDNGRPPLKYLYEG